jgi:formylglycine-generating enzyme required for sulfatase activity
LNFEISDKFSVSTRLKVGDTAASESIINKLSPDAALKGYEIIIDINGNLFWALIENASTTNYIQIKTDTGGYDDGQWHDVVATYNGNSSVSGLELYVDGVLQSSTTVVDNSTSTISNSGNLIFGGRTSNYFSGSLDEVSIWNKELTPSEVSAIYAGNTQIDLKKTSMSSNLVGWWRMGDGDTYPAIKDHSMNSNDSTMVNGPQITNIGKNYMLVDISSGPSGNSYPVTYTDTMPDLTGAGNLTYKGNVIVLKYIPAGMFTMGNATLGSNAEHKVTLTKGYYAGVFELTQRQWLNVMSSFPLGDGTQDFNNSGNTLPVQKISWEDIRGASGTYDWPNTKTVASNTFMGNLQAKTGLTFDLPTEAEWEYACRAGTSTPWPYGSVFNNSYAWTNVNSSGITHEVGSLLPNQWGLFDMHGNLNEMCLDWYVTPYSPGGDQINPEGPVSGSTRTKRGGNYSFNTDGTQSARRYSLTFGLRAIDNGFRLFMNP